MQNLRTRVPEALTSVGNKTVILANYDWCRRKMALYETVFSMDPMTRSIELPIKRLIPKKRVDEKQEK